MEAIIPIIIAVVGFLFSLLEKDKKEKGKKNKQPTPTVSSMPKFDTKTTTSPTLSKRQEVVTRMDPVIDELELLKRENASLQKKLKILEKQRILSNTTKVVNNTTNAKQNGLFTKDNIIDAVVFSEVLSAPRSKKPHSSYRRLNR